MKKEKPKTFLPDTIPSSIQKAVIFDHNFKQEKLNFLNLYIEKKFNITYICQELGITRRTFYNWREDDPNFAQALKDLRMFMCDKAEEVLLHSLGRNNPNAAMFVLKALHEDYKDKVDITSNGTTIGNVNVINIISPPKDEEQ